MALVLLVGLALTVFVIWRDADRSDATFIIGAAPPSQVVPTEITGVPRRSFALPRLRSHDHGRVLLQIATYLQKPTATVQLAVLDARGGIQARCTIPPAGYSDNALVSCDVPDLARARRLIVAHAGPAKLAVYSHGRIAGNLAFVSSGDVFSRVRSVVDRVAVSLPAGVGPAVLTAGLWLSTAAAALGVLIAIGVARERPDALLEQGEPLREPTGVLAEPRDDEREMQHDGQEEADGDNEQGVGGRDDPERAGDTGKQGGPGGKDEHGQPGGEPEH
jgi:hypothetical protein